MDGSNERMKAGEKLADVLALMKKCKIEESPPMMEKKKPVVIPSGQNAVRLTTNVYPMEIREPVDVFRYDMVVAQYSLKRDGVTEAKVLLSKKSFGGDTTLIDHQDKCRFVFTLLCRAEPLVGARCVYYDLQSIIYSLDDLGIEGGERRIELPASDEMLNVMPRSRRVVVTISAVRDDYQLNLHDLSRISSDLTMVEHSLLQFLDIATSQGVMFPRDLNTPEHVPFSCHRSYLLDPDAQGFPPLPSFRDNGSYLAIGAQKGTHCLEGPQKTKKLSLVVETKKTPFHLVQPLLSKMEGMLGRPIDNIRQFRNGDLVRLNAVLGGLEVETMHIKRRYTIKCLSESTAAQKVIEVEREGAVEEITVEEYFLRHRQIQLRFPHLPLVLTKGAKRSMLPIELCEVCDNQRVTCAQQTPQSIQEMIRHCAIAPSVLLRQNDLTYRSLHLQNRYLEAAQIEVGGSRTDLVGRSLEPPTLVFAQNRVSQVRLNNFTWINPGAYLVPGRCNKWAAFAFLGHRDNLSTRDFDTFLDRFIGMAARRGIQMPHDPYNLRDDPRNRIMMTDRNQMKQMVSEAVHDGCDFFIAVHGDNDDNTHGMIKYYEQHFGIVSQAFRIRTVSTVVQKNQPATVENIVNKTNVKLSGINYSLEMRSPRAKDILDSDTLIIGVAINHPSAGRGGQTREDQKEDGSKKPEKSAHPSIVGYSANIGANRFEFVGDFVVQKYIGEIDITVVPGIVSQCLELFKKQRNGSMPKRLLFYHNGCSEGWFEYLLRYQVPLIKDTLKKGGCGDVKVTLIVPNRLQSVRFFNQQLNPNARAVDQNIRPGLLVDHTVVHSEFAEFFLNSHRALQGTARTPKYTVLVDENDFDTGQLAEITYQLCYGHQIVYLPTSLPTPVYVAVQYAERGRKLFNQWIQEHEDDTDYECVTGQLAYRGKESLKYHRLNA